MFTGVNEWPLTMKHFAVPSKKGFPQPEFWAGCRTFKTKSVVLNIIEIDLPETVSLSQLILNTVGTEAALGLVAVTVETVDSFESLENTPYLPDAEYIYPRTIFNLAAPEDVQGWQFDGEAFSVAPVAGLFRDGTLNSLAKAGETATGKAVSPVFMVKKDDNTMILEFHGGISETVDKKANLSVSIADADTGEVLAEIQPPSTHQLMKKSIDISRFRDQKLRLILLDENIKKTHAWVGLKSVKVEK